jgi:iron complex outermembrane receptor protein
MTTTLGTNTLTPPLLRLAARWLCLGATLCLASLLHAAELPKKSFDVPAGSAEAALKKFSDQSGIDVVFPTEVVSGVRTNAVRGEFAATDALTRMLDGTNLVAVRDAKTGALTVSRATPQNAVRATPATPAARPDRADAVAPVPQTAMTPAIQLEAVEVLGSRIRRTEVEGVSPVLSYGTDEIRASGAMSLADFMRSIPQTYSGVGAGRNSAPDDLNMSAGQRNEDLLPAIPSIGGSPILGSQVPLQTGVSGVSLRGLGSGSTLVLVDGRRVAQAGERNRGSGTGQGFVDLNTIPLGLVDRIEIITDGASAIYGADAVAGVINIVLKKSWGGTEVSGQVKLTQHGGARERQTTVTTGFAAQGGRLRGTLAINYYDREPLYASQRSFTKTMDYRTKIQGYNTTTGAPVFGTDQRIQWGYPASVQATATTGFVSIPGIRVLLAPAGSATTPAISAFERRTTNDPGQTPTTPIAQGQRITNPAQWVQLLSASDRRGLTGNATYKFRPDLEGYGTYSYTDSRGLAKTLPVYVANVPVSAANNIFGENIQFGMMLPQWGQVSQQTRTQTHTITAGVRGKLGATWRWDSGYRWQDQKYHSLARSFNDTAFNALANNNDPTQRFNPFIDERVPGAPSQAALLAQTVLNPTVDGRSGLDSFDASANGDLFKIWGGTIRMALGGSYEKDKNTNTSVAFAGFPVVATPTTYVDNRSTRAAFGELSVPLFGKPNQLPLLQRLEANLAARYENISDSGSKSVPKYGATWAPFRALLLRGSYSEGFRAPSLTEDRRQTTTLTAFIVDPARGNQPYRTSYVFRSNPNVQPETSTNQFYGAVIEPPFVKGLSLSVNYYRTEQKNAIQSISSTVILNNPALFSDLVVRGAPTAADTAAGWPGVVTTIYPQVVNFGIVRNESLDFGADYRVPWEKLGRWRLSVNAAKTVKQTRQLTVGTAPINDVGDTYSSPRWNISSNLYWNKGAWTASSSFNYMSGFNTNQAGIAPTNYPTPAVHLIDVRATYEFKNGIWRNHGKGVRVGFGVANIEDAKPPFFGLQIYGFNAGLHGKYAFGRTYEMSFVVPLNSGADPKKVYR